MPDRLVRLERGEGVAWVILDSPDNRNALSKSLLGELGAALETGIGDSATRILVLTHTGHVFCAGADLKEQARHHTQTGTSPGAGDLVPILKLLLRSPKPVVCQIGGAVRGGGMGLVAASDIAVASDDSTFAFSEVRVGVAPAVIAVPVLRRVPRGAALELFLSGRTFGAPEALAVGLLHQVVDQGTLGEAVTRLCDELRKGAPGAQAAAKRIVAQVPELDPEAGFAEMVELSRRLFSSEEGQEGMSAFGARRPPSWSS